MTKRFYASHLELILSQKGCLIIQALFGRLINGRYKDTPGPLTVLGLRLEAPGCLYIVRL